MSPSTVEEWNAGEECPSPLIQVTKKDFERINSGIAEDEVVEEVKFGNVIPLEKRIVELEAQLAEVTAERDALKQ